MKIEEAMKALRQGKEVLIITKTMIDEHTALSEFLNADDYEIIEPDAPEEPAPELTPVEDETVPETRPKKKGPLAPVDHGKIVALYKANRTPVWIADDMGCSLQTVINHLKKEGIYKNEVERLRRHHDRYCIDHVIS